LNESCKYTVYNYSSTLQDSKATTAKVEMKRYTVTNVSELAPLVSEPPDGAGVTTAGFDPPLEPPFELAPPVAVGPVVAV
jgi:hypothetical protein